MNIAGEKGVLSRKTDLNSRKNAMQLRGPYEWLQVHADKFSDVGFAYVETQ
jgi:hypothetical protein